MTLGITIRISVLNLLDDTSSDTTLLNHNNRGFEACIEEESECHGWNNPRSVMVISHGNCSLFGLIMEYMNWQPIVLFLYSLKFLVVLRSIYSLYNKKITSRISIRLEN